jgi:hypothetical protein
MSRLFVVGGWCNALVKADAKRRPDGFADRIDRHQRGISVDMRIAVCCLRLAVPEKSPDDRQREAMTDANARRGMTEIMNPDALELRCCAQHFPRLRQVHERFARQPAFDDESAGRGFRPRREVAQHHQCGIAQKEGLRAGLAVGQDDAVTVPVNPVPTSLPTPRSPARRSATTA